VITRVSSHMRGWLWSSLILLILIFSCSRTGKEKSKSVKPASYFYLENKNLDLHLLLPSEFSESYSLITPFGGFRILDQKEQIYGFISLKPAKFASGSSDIDLLEANSSYDLNNFNSHWENYLQIRGINVDFSLKERFLTRDRWNNMIKYVSGSLNFPGTVAITTFQVGDYAEQTMGYPEVPATLTQHSTQEEWYDYTAYDIFLSETLIPPEIPGGKPKILVVFLVKPSSREDENFKRISDDFRSNSNLCMGKCEVKSITEEIKIGQTSPAEILFFYKNTSSMEMEINKAKDLLQTPLLNLLNENKISYKIGIATLTHPDLIPLEGKRWLTENESPDNFFTPPVTSAYLRNSLIQLAPEVVSKATDEGLFSNSDEKIIVFVTDRDDQSITPGGDPISTDNLDSFLKIYENERILPFGIIGDQNEESPYCDTPEVCTILKKFIYLSGGSSVNICSQYRYNFYLTLIMKALISASNIKLSHHPVISSLKVKFNGTEMMYGFPGGFIADGKFSKIVIVPPQTGDIETGYLFFHKIF